ncbi:hypothetical protein [Comamonas thiooxydans]|uniref:hypothetical protein n=1 Tax=Comamonas thiooxydans TaxID=363952 RepID=UPI002113FB2B|nr:hypothetical protein [Comamonas thiooxydans]UUE96642.1 hypothetical protein MJ608_14895 [Comamonas thiooxydans]
MRCWPAEQLHYEFFAAEVEHRADDGSWVEVASSNQVVRVTPAQNRGAGAESIGSASRHRASRASALA